MSAAPSGPHGAEAIGPRAAGPFPSPPEPAAEPADAGGPAVVDDVSASSGAAGEAAPLCLGALPVGARLILRCRKDWRAAAVAAFEPDRARVVLSVASPGGHTYRVRRPADSVLTEEGPLPVLGGGVWRACFARYDLRW